MAFVGHRREEGIASYRKAKHDRVPCAQTPYIWKRRADGLYVINLAKTWEKLMLAARVIVAIENPQDGEILGSHQTLPLRLELGQIVGARHRPLQENRACKGR